MAVEVKRDGAVAVVTVARPEVLNALNTATNRELLGVAREISHDAELRAVVLTGAGEKAFVAGADIAEFRGMTPEDARQASWLGRKVVEAIEGAPQPWIAAINGFALGGGCELALACDIRLAADDARFGQPEVNLGITPGFGGTQRLPREVGNGWASLPLPERSHDRRRRGAPASVSCRPCSRRRSSWTRRSSSPASSPPSRPWRCATSSRRSTTR